MTTSRSGVERTTYRLVQESLTNAAKHAEGADFEVRVERWSRELRVTVTNGRPPRDLVTLPASHPGGGLAGLAERIGMMGGRLRARAMSKGGFSVQGRLPTPPLDQIYGAMSEPPLSAQALPSSEVADNHEPDPIVKDTKVASGEATNGGSATEGARAH
ncbi:MAG: ATP-binding protein [Pseudonocardia sp.]